MKTFPLLALLLILSSSAFASPKYLYFVMSENIGKNRVYALDMDPLYRFVTSYTNDRGSGELDCTYKSGAGDQDVFTIGWEDCDHSTSMSLQLALAGVTSNYDAPFVDHKSINMNGSISNKDGNVEMAVMSATQYAKIQQSSIHDPSPLPAIGSVPSVIRDDAMDAAQQASGSVVCALRFTQQMCEQ